MTETLAPIRPGKLIINGEAVDAASGRTFTTYNPATEEAIATIAEAGPEDVERAVAAARAAFEDGPWSKMKSAAEPYIWRWGRKTFPCWTAVPIWLYAVTLSIICRIRGRHCRRCGGS